MKQSQASAADKQAAARAEAAHLAGATVLQVLPALETGGVERGTVDVAAAIVAAGGRALVVSAGGRLVRELEAAGAEHVVLPLGRKAPWAIARNAGSLSALIAREKVDLVHARSRAPAWAAWLAVRRTGTPFVTTFHGTYNFRSGFKKRYNAIMARGRPVIAISEFIAQHVAGEYGVDTSDIKVIHRGIDTERFDPAAVGAERIEAVRRGWNLPGDAPLILLPGRLTRWKGQTVLLDALAGLTHRNWAAALVGDDQGRDAYRTDLEAQIERLGLAGRVALAGHSDDMPAVYAACDIVVSASTDPEAFGRVAVEAQAMAKPVIATGHGGSAETVIDGETGWLVPPGDAAALGAALDRALSLSPADRARMGAAGRANACAHFTKAQMLEKTVAVYRDVLGGAAR